MTPIIRRTRTQVRWSGSTVLVTGGGNGLGRQLALGAARRGARVVIWDLSGERGERVRDEVRALGVDADAYTVNVSDRDAVTATAIDTGAVDIVINNAGVVTGRTLLEASEDAIQRTIDVNVLGLYWVTRAFLGGMIERRHGSVVTIASAAGLVGVAKQTDYSASKFAAVGFTESLRAELRGTRSGVRTLVVCPYYIDTGMFEGVRTRFSFLLPILKETDVAASVLDAVERGREQLVLPRSIALIPVSRLLPLPLFDRLMDLLGVNRTMDHFTGRPDHPHR